MRPTPDFPKILIISAQPYNESEQSRTLDSYFHGFPNENLVQIFSDSRIPQKGHCSKLFQITDAALIRRMFLKRKAAPKVFLRENLNDNTQSGEDSFLRAPRKKTYIYRLLRKFIWKKRYWDTKELESLVHSFRPDAIFVTSSPHFFTFEMALHFSHEYRIPIIFSITDDYYFVSSKVNPVGHIYLKKYRKLIDRVMSEKCCGVFVSEPSQEKYCSFFKIPGKVIYLSSGMAPVLLNEKIDINRPFYYFGNGGFGREESIHQFAAAMEQAGLKNELRVYGSGYKKRNLPKLLKLCGFVQYSKIKSIEEEAGALVYLESIKDRYGGLVKYSLSTKTADYLCSGKPIIVYGNRHSGAVNFMKDHNCAPVATSFRELVQLLSSLKDGSIDTTLFAKNCYETARDCFCVEKQSANFLKFINSFLGR